MFGLIFTLCNTLTRDAVEIKNPLQMKSSHTETMRSHDPLPTLFIPHAPLPSKLSRLNHNNLAPRHPLPVHHKLAKTARVTIVSTASAPTTTPTPRPVKSTTHSYRDSRGYQWTYEADILQPTPPSSTNPHRSPIIFLHTPTGLGVNKTYWNPLKRYIQSNPQGLQNHQLAFFDWVGTATSQTKPERVETPYNADYFAGQLAHFASTFGQKVVVMAQGSAEPVVVRFAVLYPHLVKGVVIATGLGTKYLTKEPNQLRKKLAYDFLTSFAGDKFWDFVATRSYLEGFSRKNLIVEEEMLDEWVTNAFEGAQDRRIRFNVFSFLSGFLFGNYEKDYGKISAPCLFLAGTEKPDRSWAKRVKSARPPAPILARESTFRDITEERMRHRCELIPNCEGAIVEGAGTEMFFEHLSLALPYLERFLNVHG